MRLNIEDRFFSEPRAELLARQIKESYRFVVGGLVILWHKTQCMEQVAVTPEEISYYMYGSDQPKVDIMTLVDAMISCQFVRQIRGGKLEISGNRKQIEGHKRYKERSRLGGIAKSKQKVAASSRIKQCLKAANTNTNTITNTITNTVLDSKESTSVSTDLNIFVRMWNENRGPLPEVRKLTTKRRRAIKARLSEEPEIAYWQTALERIKASTFCTGNSPSGWLADFDFFLRPDTHVKIYEGKYDNKKQTDKKLYYPEIGI